MRGCVALRVAKGLSRLTSGLMLWKSTRKFVLGPSPPKGLRTTCKEGYVTLSGAKGLSWLTSGSICLRYLTFKGVQKDVRSHVTLSTLNMTC